MKLIIQFAMIVNIFNNLNAASIETVLNKSPEVIGGTEALKNAFEYPKLIFNQGFAINGRSVAEFYIETDGTPKEVKIVQSLGPAFDQAMEVGISKLKFTPALVDGIPISVKYKLPIYFQRQ